jgi:hypothetical protein
MSNPNAYRVYKYSYELIKTVAWAGPKPTPPDCPQIRPKIAQCGARPVPDGTFQPRSAAYLLAVKGNDGWEVPPNSPICIDRHGPEYDRFQQLLCWDNAPSYFRIENPDLAGCYMMVDSKGNLVHPEIKDSDAGELIGDSEQAIFTHGCASKIDSVHWQLVPLSADPQGYYLIKNKLTGGCIEAIPNDRNQHPVGHEVGVQQCAPSKLHQQWKLKRIR